ncbi:putative ABC transport system substrate-binding protein [uncultured Gammaproteobacteria bacterium]
MTEGCGINRSFWSRRAVLAGLSGVLAASVSTASATSTATESRPPAARRFRIYMVVFRGWTDTDRGFKDYLDANRVPVELIVRDAKGDKGALAGIAAEIIREKPDLVYTWGTTASVEILGPYDSTDPKRYVTAVPSVFANVSNPVDARLTPNLNGSGRNIAGSTYLAPLDAQLKALRSFRPAQRLGVIYSADERNSLDVVAALRLLTAGAGMSLIERPIQPSRDDAAKRASLPRLVAEVSGEKADFLYIPPDSFLSAHGKLLTSAAIEAKLPTFAAAEGTLTGSDALMGLVSRYYNIGKLTGSLAERILVKGEKPGTMPVTSLSRYSLILNIRVALAIGIYPPMRLLKISEVIE